MKRPSCAVGGLLVSTAVGAMAVAMAQAASAQAVQTARPGAAPPPAPAADTGGSDLLSDVVVTATKQVDTVSRVPLSVTAVTQRTLDQEGIHDLNDLQKFVPSLTVSDMAGTDLITIRGIGSSLGASTTGVFLNDTNLTKRAEAGVASTNGSPAPPLFDLERVEVLRGPQGTLFGGSSEGGTIRFITPSPSVSNYSGYDLAQISTTHYGAPSYELGLAAGGPLIRDKLGARLSVFWSQAGGWIDDVNPYTAQVYKKDSNSENEAAFHGSFLWKPTERSSVTLDLHDSRQHIADASNYTLPMASTADIAASGLIPSNLIAAGWGGINPLCVAYNGTPSSSQTGVPCTTPGVTHTYPAHIWGPYNTQPYQRVTGAVDETDPFLSRLQTASLSLDYEFDHMSVKSITSYLQDEEKRHTFDTSVNSSIYRGFPGLWTDPTWNANGGNGNFHAVNKRHGWNEDLRFASEADAKPLTWVAGIYYSEMNQSGITINWEDMDRAGLVLTGLPSIARYSVSEQGEIQSRLDQWQTDIEIAAYGQATYYITDKLKAILGVRLSRVEYRYHQLYDGLTKAFYGPTAANGGDLSGGVDSSPVTPKVGLQYDITDNDQVYVTAAKGFRPGGINSPLTVATCGAALAQYGLTVNDIPTNYGPDSIWSYEVGTKDRLFQNRLQVNVAAYDIEWTNLQTTLNVNSLGCGIPWIQNVGTARSYGVDFEAQARLFEGFTVSTAISYDKAYYSSDALGPTPLNGKPTVFDAEGTLLGVRPWNILVNAQYNFNLMRYTGYVRGDWNYVPRYDVSAFGVTGYSPDSSFRNATSLVNVRAGVLIKGLDLNLFVNNLFESRDGTPTGGRTGCAASSGPACTTFTNYNPLFSLTTFRPREIGIQAAFRY